MLREFRNARPSAVAGGPPEILEEAVAATVMRTALSATIRGHNFLSVMTAYYAGLREWAKQLTFGENFRRSQNLQTGRIRWVSRLLIRVALSSKPEKTSCNRAGV